MLQNIPHILRKGGYYSLHIKSYINDLILGLRFSSVTNHYTDYLT